MSVQAVCKNTFLTFVTKDADDSVPVSLLPSPRLPPRSRSAEIVRSHPEVEEFQDLTQQSIQRLNVALSIGISSPRQQPQKVGADTGDDFILDQSTTGNNFSELRVLQSRLATALDSPKSQPSTKPWSKNLRVSSSCSLSTMAPDDASESAEPSGGGMRRMPHVGSSGSVSTMVSDWNECFDEDGEFEFELDIKEVITSASSPAKQAQTEMSHSLVPRTQNMEAMYNSSKEEPPTTMMIRNLPGRYSQNELMVDLQQLGLAGTYDFLYIPIDKRTAANVGYAFVNFIDPAWASRCTECFEGYRFTQQKRSSNKLGSVSVAFLQGLEKNLEHYEHSAVNMSRDKRRKPVVMPNISQACS